MDPLDFLTALQRQEVEQALADPVQRERFQVAALVQLRDTVEELSLRESRAKDRCLTVCKPEMTQRFERLERFRSWLVGIGVGFGALVTLAVALWTIFGRGGG